VSDVEWVCGECDFTGEKDQVLDHHRQTGHVYAAGDYIFMVDLDTITIGVTGWAHEGIKPTWVHANFCHRYDCRTVLNDDEVQDHVRRHIANGDYGTK
jgi:hypothetical protein